MSKRVAIPTLKTGAPAVDKHALAVKLTLDQVTGQHANVPNLKRLGAAATLPEVIEQLNLVIDRLQGS